MFEEVDEMAQATVTRLSVPVLDADCASWELAEEKGLSVPQIALSYVLSFPLDIYALVGSMNSDEIASNLQALQTRLTEAEMAWLDLRSETR